MTESLSCLGGPAHAAVVTVRPNTSSIVALAAPDALTAAERIGPGLPAPERLVEAKPVMYVRRTLVWPPPEAQEGPTYVRDFLVADSVPEADLVALATALDLTERGAR